ncbi:hypothetical protein N7491_001868 [Penicillium cf. griseofulvum]|uniref:Uncharacterized protein n=1 Tax=Penicillium cf. griseofulvum TaxID=2972120 RepID=A0A9W9MUC7_9EURO|nr:hypothetical protein N7472_003951 [Penicillium cf. griseofulvum]KAJ5445786.1 hypothetical protein N7491_001868 [Penicillium cf. griseofulvum]KAJ5447508.1 hypothetical protein N7445_002329 [Penicillium cf. griseofulvum]
MPESSRLSRYDHFKAIFSRNFSQEREIKDDATSETTLVPRQTKAKSYKKRVIPQNYNGEYLIPNVMSSSMS